jgi:predicted nucleotidyltransferase
LRLARLSIISPSEMRSSPFPMRNPFLSSAGPRFANREEVLALARETAARIAAAYPQIFRIILFGSFARGDYGTRSDLDLLVIFRESEISMRELLSELIRFSPAYPTDFVPLTRFEVDSRLAEGDPFLSQAIGEGIVLYPDQ